MRARWPALGATLVLAILVTWPLAADPRDALGHPGNDVWNHLWGYWWVAEEIAAGRAPLRTDLMHFPDSSRLFFIDTFGAVLTLPIQWLAGPVVAYNATILLCFWMAGLGAWALARHVLAARIGPGRAADGVALFAAAAYAASPHLLAQAYNGITETLFAAGLPFGVLATMRLYERPTWGRAAVAAAAMALCTLANWYYGLFAILGSALLLVSFAILRRERIRWGALPATLGLAAVLAGAAVMPVLLGFAATLDGEDAIVQRDPDFVWRSLISHNMTDVVSAFRPGKVYSPDLKAEHGEDLLIVTYVGWTLLVLATAGLFSMKRWRDRLPWIAWLAAFGSLMLGPYLYVGGEYVTVFDRRVPLPFLALFDALPVFQRISHPFRFVMPVQLGLAVLGCVALARLPVAARFGVTGLLLVEVLRLSPAPWPLPLSDGRIPAYARTLEGEPGAVIDLPIAMPNLERAVYLYWQTAHGRASPYSLNEPLPEVLSRSHLGRTLLIAEAARLDRLPPVLPELDLVASGRALAELGVRFVVVHDALYPPERLAQTLTILRTALGPETTVTDDARHIWRLPAPQEGS